MTLTEKGDSPDKRGETRKVAPPSPLTGDDEGSSKSEAIEDAESTSLLHRFKALNRQDKYSANVFVILWAGLIAFTVTIWDPFQIRHHDRQDTLLDGTLPAGGMHLGDKPLANDDLAPFTFEPLPLGSIKPEGWIRDQMNLMANGLAGHQYDFYHIVSHSPWLGGHTQYSDLHEGLPYWFNGLVPLAYGLGNKRLQAQVLEVADKVLTRQAEDGWLGPEIGAQRDIWARFPFCLGLVQLAEAVPELAPRIVHALHRFIRIMHDLLQEGRAYGSFWGTVRYPDMLATLQWLYEKHPLNNTGLLASSMVLLHREGFDWPGFWTNGSFIFVDLDTVKPSIDGNTWRFRHSHSVNVGQGLSAGAAIYRFTKNDSLLDVNRRGVKWTFDYHGDVAGSIIGDERESGLAPNRGSELCTASEVMYSLSYLYHVIGDKEFADREELAAFNSWPVAITADHWARQYLNVANSPTAKRIYGDLNFWNTGFESLVYGVDTNYPCCTVNMPQGLPKYLSASFVRVGNNGIGHALLGPASLSTMTNSGVSVNITCQTKYPFGMTFDYAVTASRAFTLYIRVPAWVDPKPLMITAKDGKPQSIQPDQRTGMTSVAMKAGENHFSYQIDTSIRIVPRGNSSVAIYHGSLLYALDVGETKYFSANTPSPNVTYNTLDGTPTFPKRTKKVEITNTLPWNIGIDPSSLQFHVEESEGPLANPVFDYKAPPTFISGRGCPISWPMKNGLPDALKALPHGRTKRNCTGKAQDIILRPYGSLKVHMAELPIVDLSTASH